MPEIPRSTQATHFRARHRMSSHHNATNVLEPVMYFSVAVVLLVLAELMHSDILSPLFGAIGIIIISVSKIWKFKPGIILSIVCILAMALNFIWQWITIYFIAILSAEVSTNKLLFVSGLSEGLILLTIGWIFYRILKSVRIRMGQKWLVKRSSLIFFKLLFYFQLFLVLFWTISCLIIKAQIGTRLSLKDGVMIAGALALLISGIPAIIYLAKGSTDEENRHLHRHHHRHGRSEMKNVDSI